MSLGYPLSILTVFLGLSSQQLVQEEALSPEIILSNTYHLALQPGEVKTNKNNHYSLHDDRIRHLNISLTLEGLFNVIRLCVALASIPFAFIRHICAFLPK